MTDSNQEWPWLREIVIDRNDPTPPVEQIASAIRNKIATGKIRANDLLPSVRVLASKVGTTSATISRTYQALQREGLIQSSSGFGTTVVDIENLQQSARKGMLKAACQVLDQALQSVLSLGVSESELGHLLKERYGRITGTSRLVFISARHTNLELYERQLREATSGLPVKVACVALEDLEARESTAWSTVHSADFLTSLVTYKRKLTGLVPDESAVHFIIAEVVMEAIEALSQLPPETNIVVAARDHFRTVALGILHTYCPPDRIEILRAVEEPATWRKVAADTVVVHTYELAEQARRFASQNRLICLDFKLRADSLDRLRNFLAMHFADERAASR